MKLLLDTHTFLWLLFEPSQLSSQAVQSCYNLDNQILVSVVSLWEIMIKQQAGKISIKRPIELILQNPDVTQEIVWLPVVPRHILSLETLPLVHRDPFDRMLIAQAKDEQATLVSKDHLFQQYPISVIW